MKTALGLILIGIASRLLSLPHGLSLTAAVILLAGARMGLKYAALVALAVMGVGDAFKGFHQLIPWTWTGAILIAGVSLMIRKRQSYPRIGLASMIGSTVYYLWCESGIWMMGSCLPGERLYPLTLSALVQVYQSGLNHYLYALGGNLAFTLVLFAIVRNFSKLPADVIVTHVPAPAEQKIR